MHSTGTKLWTAEFISITIINLLMFLSFHMLISTFPFYINFLGGDEAIAGLTAGLFAIASVLVRPIAGWILDHKGRVAVLLCGIIGMLLLPLAYPIIKLLIIAVIVRVIHGVVWSFASTSVSTLACDIIPHSRFGEGMGIFGTGSAISMAVGPVLGLYLLNSSGYNVLFGFSAGFALLSLLIIISKRKSLFIVTKLQTDLSSRKLVLIDKNALPASLTMFLFLIPYGAISTFIALYAVEINIANGGIFFTLMAVTTVLTRGLSGRTVDKVGERPIVIVSVVAQLISLALLAFAPGIVGFIISALCFGIGFGMMSPTMQTLAVRLSPENKRGAASSTFLCAFDCGIGLGGVIAGYLLRYFDYSQMFAIMLLFIIASFIVYYCWTKKSRSSFSHTEEL